jgi:hypothetical protein
MCVAVIAAGASKADAVKGCLEPAEGQDRLPAGRARPTAGELLWFLWMTRLLANCKRISLLLGVYDTMGMLIDLLTLCRIIAFYHVWD